MAFLTSTNFITWIHESTTGTFVPSVSATDVDVRLREVSWTTEIDRDNAESEYATSYWFGGDESVTGKRKFTAGGSIKLAPGQFTPSTSAAPAKHVLAHKDLFEHCGCTVVGVGTSGTDNTAGKYVIYPDQNKAENTLSMARILYSPSDSKYLIEQGYGAIGNFTIDAEASKPFTTKFEFKGAATDPIEVASNADVATISISDVMRTVADVMRDTTVTFTSLSTSAANTFCITKLSFESGNQINENECQDNSAGLRNMFIPKFSPKMTLNPLLKSKALWDWWKAVSTSNDFYKIVIESPSHKLYIPRAQVQQSSISDANGQMRQELTFRPIINLDSDCPSELPVGQRPTSMLPYIPWFFVITEKLKDY